MPLKTTEMVHHESRGLDARPLPAAARLLAHAQVEAAGAVVDAIPAACDGALAMARAIRGGGRLWYVAAGSSALMAAADAMELGGTFGIPEDQVRIVMAGGLPTSARMPGASEDDIASLDDTLATLAEGDVLIAVSASGSTPFALAAIRIALARQATVIGIANNAGCPVLEAAHHAIALVTPPEVLAGSTRLGAGTAQKIALNVLSTLMAIDLGHVHDGLMVNLVADNAKLRDRAARIVQAIAGVSEDAALAALSATGGHVKPAVLVAAGLGTPDEAARLLAEAGGRLRPVLDRTGAHNARVPNE